MLFQLYPNVLQIFLETPADYLDKRTWTGLKSLEITLLPSKKPNFQEFILADIQKDNQILFVRPKKLQTTSK